MKKGARRHMKCEQRHSQRSKGSRANERGYGTGTVNSKVRTCKATPYGIDTDINRVRDRHSDAVDKSASEQGIAVATCAEQATTATNSRMESGQTAQI